MADLIEAMERLWFHQIILVSEPNSILLVNPSKHSLAHNFMNSQTLLPPDDDDDEISSLVLSTPSSSLLYKDDSDIEHINERPTISNLIARRAHSHSSLPATQPQRRLKRHVNHPKNPKRLQKSMSCRSFQELELEELKRFMDLGFNFKKEHLSPRLLTVIPGLQRKGSLPTTDKDKELAAQEGGILFEEEEEEEEEEDQSSSIIRPYLSEAWLIREPVSPLLNLRVPRVTAASDMKKHLRFWARSVASVVQQES